MYADREVFLNPPLVYVAAEVRYPYAPRLRQQDIRDAILIDLEDLFPILRSQPQLTMTGIVGGAVSQQMDQVTRAFNRPSNAAVSVTANTLTIDTTAYEEFTEFRSVISRCLAAVDQHASPAAIERVGLRYINEVRVPENITDVREWRGWIADALVDVPAMTADYQAVNLQGAVQYTTGEHRSLTFRFAAAPAGSMIGNEPLKRRHFPPEGPFFALDLDSFWQPPPDESPDWALDTIMTVMDQLHGPIGATFQSAITDKLRDTVLRRTNGH